MKKFLAMVCLACATSLTQGALIAGWNFNSQTSGTAPTPISADHGSGSLDLSHLFSSSDAVIGGASSGTSVNKVTGDANGKDFIIASGTKGALPDYPENGKSIVFSFSTTGYKDIVLTYATLASSTGFTSQQWRYSTDGINYTSFGSAITPGTITYTATGIETVNFSSATAVNNDATVYFELTLSGSTGGSDHFDNFQFNADVVPEPAEWGLISGLGLLGICGVRTWREQRAAKHATLA